MLASENGVLEETTKEFSDLAHKEWSAKSNPERLVFFYETQRTQLAKAAIPRAFVESWAEYLVRWAEIIVCPFTSLAVQRADIRRSLMRTLP